jgi:Asp-tRNA(Asn)/Glu-tRNA(Gln) amidotransferase A subunit family amidase
MFEMPPPPRLSGTVLRSLIAATAAEPVRRGLIALMRKDLGMDAMSALPAALRQSLPLNARPLRARRERARGSSADLPLPKASAILPSAAVYHERYRKKDAKPDVVCERVIAEARRLASATPAMQCFLEVDADNAMRDARASAERWARGEPKSALDGVPIPIKEELDLAGLGNRLGTTFVPRSKAAADAACVAQLRAAGAIIVGQTVMTEMGMSPLGGNIHRNMPRNAHAVDRLAGGSSTGSGVAVAVGLAPGAIGSDGGGSIRIPAAFNGVFGIKPTFGRVSRRGDGFGGTMAHVGPLGASAYDLAVVLEHCSMSDPDDELTHGAPDIAPGELVSALGRGVRGMRIGVLESEIDAADPAIGRACRDALAELEKEGAELVPLQLPLAKHAPAIGMFSIGLEAYSALLDARRHHWEALGPDLQLLVRLQSQLRSDDYLDAQCLRGTLRVQTAELLRGVDVIALPTTQSVAPAVTEAELIGGFVDTPALAAATRFAFLGNLTGLPCGTAPVGNGEAGMPAGLQIVGDAWDEHSVLAVLAHLERAEIASVREPRIGVRPLG